MSGFRPGVFDCSSERRTHGNVLLAVFWVAVFHVGSWFEHRGPGPVTAQQAVEDATYAR